MVDVDKSTSPMDTMGTLGIWKEKHMIFFHLKTYGWVVVWLGGGDPDILY